MNEVHRKRRLLTVASSTPEGLGLTPPIAGTSSWYRGILGVVQGRGQSSLDAQSASSGLRGPLALNLHTLVREVAEATPDAASAGVSFGKSAWPASALGVGHSAHGGQHALEDGNT